MTLDVAIPPAHTVRDVWRVRSDWRAAHAAAQRLRQDWPAAAAELLAAADALRQGQELLDGVLERVEVPMTWHPDGRLTFFPHDRADLDAIRAAQSAARDIHARLDALLARHRAALDQR